MTDFFFRYDSLKKNHEKVMNCPGHRFSKELKRIYISIYTCDVCGGVITGMHRFWYERGFKHGSELKKINDHEQN